MGQSVQLGAMRRLRPRMDLTAAIEGKVPVPATGKYRCCCCQFTACSLLVQQISFVGIVHGLQSRMHLEFV